MKKLLLITLLMGLFVSSFAFELNSKDDIYIEGIKIQTKAQKVYNSAIQKQKEAKNFASIAKEKGFKDFNQNELKFKIETKNDVIRITVFKNDEVLEKILTDEDLNIYLLQDNFSGGKFDEYLFYKELLTVYKDTEKVQKNTTKAKEEYSFYKQNLDSYDKNTISDRRKYKSDEHFSYIDNKLNSYCKKYGSIYSKSIYFNLYNENLN